MYSSNIIDDIAFKLDRSEWKLTKLGDVSSTKSVRENNPSNSKYDKFVGSSCINEYDLKIQNWEDTSTVTSAMKVFNRGEYLLVRRSVAGNQFKRRAARADFEGICSGDIINIRENDEFISDGFLAYILYSDDFWEYAISNASGSITSRVKWKDLANYEFLLPPKNQQAQLSKLLWAMDEVIERDVLLFNRIDDFLKVKREELIIDQGFKMIRLDEICDKKISYGIVQAGPDIKQGMPYIKSSNLSEDGIKIEELNKTSDEIAQKYRRSEVKPGDIVFSLRGNLAEMNIVPEELKVANLTQGTARISVSEVYDNNYMKSALETSKIQRRIHALSKGSTFKEISLEALRTVKVPVPSEDKAREISKMIKSIEVTRKEVKQKLVSNKSLQKSLINQIF
jgi:restriction endonuclease S subunit